MTTSKLLPTTVDTTNNLVNYIEIGPDQLSDGQNSDRATDNDAMSSVPNETSTQDPADPSYKEGGKLAASKPSLVQKRSGGPPVYTQTIPSYLTDLERPDHRSAPESQQPNPEHPEQTNYELALEAQRELPDPPTLPSFLSKVILNQPTPTGDDSSVLQVPVHSVLSHLATSAIKDGVIAVSATCRYRRKYVTTILYKPAGGITAR